jgi:hypothetical protein
VEALVGAGLALREAQEQAFTDEDARDAVRKATSAEREAARTLTRIAQELLENEGRPATRAVIERIGGLLRSAAITPTAGDALRAGRLTEEIAVGGFDALAGLKVPTSPRRRKAQPEKRVDRRHEQRLQRLRDRYDELEEQARAAEREADDAERAAGKARAAADRARAASDRARAALEEAEDG